MAKLCLSESDYEYMGGDQTVDSDFQILKNIEQNKNATQRELSKSTGISLGNVNIIIKRMVKSGLLKVEKASPRTLRYVLTPSGIKRLAEITYRHIINSISYIDRMNSKIDSLFKEMVPDKNHIYLIGHKDELYHIIHNRLKEMKLSFTYIKEDNEMLNNAKSVNQSSSPEKNNSTEKNDIILVWNPEYAENFTNNNIKYVNLLEIV